MKIVSICAGILLLAQVRALSVLLQKADPYCFQVIPLTPQSKIVVNYVLTGMAEDQVMFTVSAKQLIQ